MTIGISETFNLTPDHVVPNPVIKKVCKKRRPPFSLRLSDADRARLAIEAAGAPLGAYIKAKVLGETVSLRMRRTGLAIEDRHALAHAAAQLQAMLDANPSGSLGNATLNDEAALKQSGLL